MVKNPDNGVFELIKYLERDIHQFKFIVNGNLTFSQNYKITKDSRGNINNIIDLYNYRVPQELELQPKIKEESQKTEKVKINKPTKMKNEFN